MVHALIEAQRSLKPDGTLIDLRPAPKHRQVGLGTGENWKPAGHIHETFEDDYAANSAVKHVVNAKLFTIESSILFELDRVMDTLEDFRRWLSDSSIERLTAHQWLVDKIRHIQKETRTRKKITMRVPMIMNVLKKL